MDDKMTKLSVAAFFITTLFILLYSVYDSQSSANELYQNTGTNSILAPVVVGMLIMSVVVMLYSLERQRLEIEKTKPAKTKPAKTSMRGIELETVGSHETNPFANRIATEQVKLVGEDYVDNSSVFYLAPGLPVPTSRLQNLVYESMRPNGPRLGIAQWRKRGWLQMELEALLDIMYSLKLVTKRTAGRQCVYLNAPSPEFVLRKLAFYRANPSHYVSPE